MVEKTLLPGFSKYPAYLAPIVEKLAGRYSFIEEIAPGKTGITYKLRSNDNEHLCFCLKTIKPEVTDPKLRSEVRENLKKECEILAPLAHRCLPTIFESNFSVDPPYYICTYHPGVTFSTFRTKKYQCRFHDGIAVIWSLVNTLKYLHERGRTHSDLHLKNIMIGDNVARDGLLIIDFGSGHRLSDSSPETPNRGNVNFKDFEGARSDRFSVPRASAHQSSRISVFLLLVCC